MHASFASGPSLSGGSVGTAADDSLTNSIESIRPVSQPDGSRSYMGKLNKNSSAFSSPSGRANVGAELRPRDDNGKQRPVYRRRSRLGIRSRRYVVPSVEMHPQLNVSSVRFPRRGQPAGQRPSPMPLSMLVNAGRSSKPDRPAVVNGGCHVIVIKTADEEA